jgi:nicotinamidase-related amidase
MKNENSAVLVIEFQKTWTEKSFFNKLIKKEYENRGVYNNTRELLEVSRNNGILVIQSPFILDKAKSQIYKKMPWQPKLLNQFTANTWRAEYTKGIFHNSDKEVNGRTGFDSTVNSNLIEILENRDIKKVYILGFTTDHCVKDTFIGLSSKGFECILVSDCTAARNNKIQLRTEKEFSSLDHNEIIRTITSDKK